MCSNFLIIGRENLTIALVNPVALKTLIICKYFTGKICAALFPQMISSDVTNGKS